MVAREAIAVVWVSRRRRLHDAQATARRHADALPFRVPEVGILLAPVALGLALAAASSAAAFSEDVAGRRFGWRQPLGLLGIGAEADAQSWQEQALCAETDPEAFFPEKGGSTREAKKICTGCEVKAQCLEYALSNDERFGIWGGLSERERRRLRRRAV